MNSPAQPVLTVRSNRSSASFAPGRDVVVGSDLHADVRVAHPVVARAHLLLRFDRGRWIAIDNNTQNGLFANGQRVSTVDIRDGQSLSLGLPEGPRLSFDVGRHQGPVGLRPLTTVSIPTIVPPQGQPPPQSRPPPAPPHQPTPAPPRQPPPAGPPQRVAPPARPPKGVDALRTTAVPIIRPGAETQAVPQMGSRSGPPGADSTQMQVAPASGRARIGRELDNEIVIHDVLASRHHAVMVPTPKGTEIRDAGSINGTFVNGKRVGTSVLSEGDVVTIGNVDLVFAGGTLVRRQEVATRSGGLEVRDVDFAISGKNLLEKVALSARPGTLTAIIGGSGAGKSTLSRLIAGYTTPTAGSVTFEGHNIHTEYATMRTRIGMVPQDDVVHRQLTVNQALGYAAELRLPPDTSKADREQVVAQVLEELGLTEHADTRVDKLSGGQRKRASVALELLTGPSLLILDEPTSGLDPALDLQVMTMLRQLADAGRVVLVVTHSLTHLDICDQVLLMAPGGKTAFLGAPGQIGDVMGTTNWAEIFGKVGADPDEANRRFLARKQEPPPTQAEVPGDLGAPAHTHFFRQFSTIARRQMRLVVSDRGYFAFLALLPFIMGVLSLTVPGNSGFRVPDPTSETPDQAAQILTLLSIAAVFMGTALTIRDLIGERPIFRREQAVGLSTWAYLGAKTTVFCAFAIVQSAIATGIVLVGKGAPSQPPVLLGNSSLELFVTVAATCVASAILGMVLSALARSNEQIMPLLVVSLMLQLVLAGGLIPVTGRLFLDQLSWVMPSRWGYAASASTINLRMLVPVGPKDSHWAHATNAWLLDMGMLATLSAIFTAIVWWRIRLKR